MTDKAPSRRAVHAVFAIILLSLPAQMAATNWFSEPYPAIMQPGFGRRGVDRTGRYDSRSTDFVIEWEDGGMTVLRPSVLLPYSPGFRGTGQEPTGILWHNFRPSSERRSPPPEMIPPDFAGASGLERLVRSLMPGYVIHETKRRFEPEAPRETRDWLRSRLATLFPGRCPAHVRVQWYRDEYTVGPGTTRRRYPTGTFEIALAQDQCLLND